MYLAWTENENAIVFYRIGYEVYCVVSSSFFQYQYEIKIMSVKSLHHILSVQYMS